MLEILSKLLNIIVFTFAVSSMLSVGFSYTIREIIVPLRNLREVFEALIANFILVPLLGYLIIQVFSLDKSMEAGILLLAFAAGAPFLIKLTIAAERDVAISAALLVLLVPTTILYMPIIVPIAIPESTVSAINIAIPLLLTMLLPLTIAFFIKAYFPQLVTRLQPLIANLSSITLVLLMALTFVVYLKDIQNILGERVILAAALLIIGAFGIGYLLGGPGRTERDILGLGTAQRNIAAATVVASQGFEDKNTLVVVVLSSLLALLLLFPIAKILRKIEYKRFKANSSSKREEI
jgi:BASS family bile acid:Na+ symporter